MTATTPSTLERILRSTREEVQRRKRELPLAGVQATAAGPAAAERRGGRFRRALEGPGIAVIAEFKRRSPSAGTLRQRARVDAIVGDYERGGAAAISILTEEANFGGSLGDLRAARSATALPLLRKDFIVDDYQLHEALAAGADAVLLIVAALTDAELGSLHHAARALGLEVLVEVHDRDELQRALQLAPELIGINNRDLRDFSVDVARTATLIAEVPNGVTVVSESGIAGPAQLPVLREAGVQAVLVGESLMRSSEPLGALQALVAAARPDAPATGAAGLARKGR